MVQWEEREGIREKEGERRRERVGKKSKKGRGNTTCVSDFSLLIGGSVLRLNRQSGRSMNR